MDAVRKLLNHPDNAVKEAIEGLIAISNGKIKSLDNPFAIAKSSIPTSKVGIVIGGGSGHEPLFAGYLGDGLADGVACGNFFAAPTPDIILEATKYCDQGNGVLYVVANYSGDVMNFEMAAEMAADEGIKTKTVIGWDDVASASADNYQDRRGIAGYLYILKIAGALATQSTDLDLIHRMAEHARDNIRSIGVALRPGSMPNGQAFFELPSSQIEIGMGIHGEIGVAREDWQPVDQLANQLVDRLLTDLPFRAGDETCLLVNSLGSTTMMELLILNRKVRQILADSEIKVYDTLLGNYCTSQEMAGFSLSLLRLDKDLKELYDAPAKSLGLTKE